jgi:hypothetical protein
MHLARPTSPPMLEENKNPWPKVPEILARKEEAINSAQLDPALKRGDCAEHRVQFVWGPEDLPYLVLSVDFYTRVFCHPL